MNELPPVYVGLTAIEFYDIFLGARACRMIPASPSEEDRAFLEEAHLILLAGATRSAASEGEEKT